MLTKNRRRRMATGEVISYQTSGENLSDTDKILVKFEIDPSLSGIKDENVKLAKYLHEKLLNIDIFDADSHFLFATCKLPMYDLLRQQKPHIVKAKRAECTDPDLPGTKGELTLIVRHEGHTERDISRKIDHGNHLKLRDTKGMPDTRQTHEREGRIQPSQQKSVKVVRSKPMQVNRIDQTGNVMADEKWRFQEYEHALTGGKILESNFVNFERTPMLQGMNEEQKKKINENQDLRKKLRIDRMKKLN